MPQFVYILKSMGIIYACLIFTKTGHLLLKNVFRHAG